MLRKVSNASTHRGCRANIFSAACLALRGPIDHDAIGVDELRAGKQRAESTLGVTS
jgi:hypothetical protein